MTFVDICGRVPEFDSIMAHSFTNKSEIDYSLYLVTGRDLLPKGKVRFQSILVFLFVFELIRVFDYKLYHESLEEVRLPHCDARR